MMIFRLSAYILAVGLLAPAVGLGLMTMVASIPLSHIRREKRGQGADRDSWSVRHLARQRIAENQSRRRTKSASLQAKDQVPGALEQLTQKASRRGPAQRHHAAGDARHDQRRHHLGGP